MDVNYVTHEQLTAGGRLEFDMSPEPEKERGISPSARPYSMSTQGKVKQTQLQDIMSTLNFSGIFPPLPTPFDNDENLLPEKIRFNIERLSRYDLAGFLILGSNGEQVMLSEKEKIEAIAAAREALPEGRLLLAGTGCQSTRETISLTRAAAAAGAHAVLVLNPFYYKGNMNHDELVRHYYDVADASTVPVLVYNMPGKHRS
jgi:4-hydroxy-2-oxoglutarate aldolase